MSGSLEEAYVAVERAYGQGDFAQALQLAAALQPQVPTERADLLSQRLQLLIGHIHLYGLNQPAAAADAYRAVLDGCEEPSYRELANQGLELSRQQMPAAAKADPEPDPDSKPEPEPEIQPTEASPPDTALPATPWLSQLQDPQQALRDIQQAWASTPPSPAALRPPERPTDLAATPWESTAPAQPAATVEPAKETLPPPVEPTATAATSSLLAMEAVEPELGLDPQKQSPPPAVGETSDPEAIIPVVVTVEGELEVEDAQGESSAGTQASSVFSEEEWADLARGLLLVQLSSSAEAPSR